MEFYAQNFENGGAVPKFQTTQRKPGVIEAVFKLWKKMNHLESQNTMKPQHAVGIQTKINDEMTQCDAESQCRLLELQLKFLRNLLAQSLNEADIKSASDPVLKQTVENPQEKILHSVDNQSASYGAHKEIPHNNKIISDVLCGMNGRKQDCSRCASGLVKGQHECPEKLPYSVPIESTKVVSSHAKVKSNLCNPVYTRTRHLGNRATSQRHYHLNIKDIPFLLGTSTTASHSVIANVQNIIAMMKAHHAGLCAAGGGIGNNFQSQKANVMGEAQKHTTLKNGVVASSGTVQMEKQLNINELLHTLQDELDGLTLEEKKLKQQLAAVQNPIQEEALHHEQNALASRVESKIQQIETLCSLLVPVKKIKRKQRRRMMSATTDYQTINEDPSIPIKMQCPMPPKHLIARPISTATKSKSSISGNKQLLQELNKLKTVLSQDDVCWI